VKRIILGVTGSIAAYKAADITSSLVKLGYAVEVILTRDGSRFITALTLQTLSLNRVHTDMFAEDFPREVQHISLAKRADLFLVAPASADIIAKLTYGLADDMLSAVALALDPALPAFIAPAMNTNMYQSAPVQDNLAKLLSRGWRIIEPKEGRLACGDLGKGALAGVEEIVASVVAILGSAEEGR
jgi:phosphopantothenoylcysteine decarboxylase